MNVMNADIRLKSVKRGNKVNIDVEMVGAAGPAVALISLLAKRLAEKVNVSTKEIANLIEYTSERIDVDGKNFDTYANLAKAIMIIRSESEDDEYEDEEDGSEDLVA